MRMYMCGVIITKKVGGGKLHLTPMWAMSILTAAEAHIIIQQLSTLHTVHSTVYCSV